MYAYLGLIKEQRVVRIPLNDKLEILKRLAQGWVYTTTDAYHRYIKGIGKIFIPTEYPTGSGKMIFSSVVYPPRTFRTK